MKKISKKYYLASLVSASLMFPVASSAESLQIVTGVDYDGGQINWDVLPRATGYNVHYFSQDAGWSYLTTVGNVTSYVPAVTGDYIIVGYDNAGNFSPFQIDGGINDTNTVDVESLGSSSTPASPIADTPAGQLPIITGVSFNDAKITWDALSEAIGYNVYYAAPGAGWVYTETIGTGTAYTPELTGSYLIVGYDNAGNFSPFQINGGSDDTNYVDIRLGDTPAGQLGIVTGVAFDGSNMTWDALTGATGYNVHYFYEGSGWSYLETVGYVTSYVPEMTGSYIIVGYDDAGNFGPFQINGGGNSNAIDI